MNSPLARAIKIALCQFNPTVGDLKGNCGRIMDEITKAKNLGIDLIVFPELAITGYPPEDLLLKSDFIAGNLRSLKEAAGLCHGIAAIIGFANKNNGRLYNSAAFIKDGKVVAVQNKICLPNYGVFDEKRYFSSGKEFRRLKLKGTSFSIAICEDLWDKKGAAALIRPGSTDLIIAINASPYYSGKWKERERTVKDLARQKHAEIAYLNIVGGQDEIVFDGMSFVVDDKGVLKARAKQFKEDLLIFDAQRKTPEKTVKNKKDTKLYLSIPTPLDRPAEIYGALCLGLRDYVRKNGFKDVVFGLSGGIDSALVAAIAADSLGKDNVKAVFMPSKYTSAQSRQDAVKLAENLGIDLSELPIGAIFDSFLSGLENHFSGTAPNIAEENLQARIRGTLLMALSNKFGYLVLATGNKSEVSTGYATLYGDMAGGLAVIKDVPKTLVYDLANYRNRISEAIPQSIIERAPTAELKENQKDQDSLPPYDVLDEIISEYVEKDKSAEDIIRKGTDPDTVKRTIRMIDASEYKRRQAAPGIKITPKSFGKDRRIPITNGYK